jgi:hypothetical protein
VVPRLALLDVNSNQHARPKIRESVFFCTFMKEAKYKTSTTIERYTEFQVEQTEAWIVEKYAQEFLPKFEWENVKKQWKFISAKDRWVALAKRRLQLDAGVNVVVAREILSYFPVQRELTFYPNQQGPNLNTVVFTGDKLKGKSEQYG